MTRRQVLLALAAAGCAVPAVAAVKRRTRPSAALARMTRAAHDFLGSLQPDQKSKAAFAFNDAERLNWHFVPRERKGLPLGDMTPDQHNLALELLRVGLSVKGFNKAAAIRQLELVLREIENNNIGRNPERYFFTVFGEPSETEPWGWRYEGHHCSQNWTAASGQIIASSPQFFGANPAEVRSGPQKGTRVLAAEEDLARTLVKSLDETQRKQAVVSDQAPPEIITGELRQAGIQDQTGILYPDLKKDQQGLLLALLDEYAGAQQPDVARDRLEKLRVVGMDKIRFAWMGGLERGVGHYYRIQGPTFLIEYDNTQNNANHIHAVWRDFNGDFGLDFLALHYPEHPH